MTLFKIIIKIIIMTRTMIIIVIIIIIIILTILKMTSTTIFQNVTEKLEKMTYFLLTILGVLLLPKVLYATHG